VKAMPIPAGNGSQHVLQGYCHNRANDTEGMPSRPKRSSEDSEKRRIERYPEKAMNIQTL